MINGVTYAYEVRVVDGPHEVGEVVEPGPSQDLERTAFELRNTNQVPGWFDPTDDRVDFNDFFIFADNFGGASSTMSQSEYPIWAAVTPLAPLAALHSLLESLDSSHSCALRATTMTRPRLQSEYSDRLLAKAA